MQPMNLRFRADYFGWQDLSRMHLAYHELGGIIIIIIVVVVGVIVLLLLLLLFRAEARRAFALYKCNRCTSSGC